MNEARTFLAKMRSNTKSALNTSLVPQLQVGTVISISPIRIQVDQNVVIDVEEMGVRLDFAKPLETRTTEENAGAPWNLYHKHSIQGQTEIAGDPPHSHEINFDSKYAMETFRGWEGLRLNDEVIMLSIDSGRRFIILSTIAGAGNIEHA